MMKKRILKKIGICFALVMAMCFTKGTDAQAAEEVGTVINVNEKVTGALESSGDVDWYTFHVTERSITNLTFGVNSIVDKEKAEDGWDVYLYNEQYEELKKYNGVVAQKEFANLALGKGTYYIKVEATPNMVFDYPIDCTYALTVHNMATNNWEIEKNQNRSQATSITANKEYHGSLHCTSDEDWYKVKVEKQGYIRIALGLASMEDSDKMNDGWKVTLFDNNNRQVQSYKFTSKAETVKIPMATGTYYLKVEAADIGYLGECAPVDCEYVFTVKNTQSSVWESEWNNAKSTADKISLNKKYYGILHAKDDMDYYKVSVDAAGKLKVKFAPDVNVDSSKVGDGWNVNVYRGTNTKALISWSYLEKSASKTINVTKGTYYIKVEPASTFWTSAFECPYNVTANYCKNPNKATISSVTAGKKTATVKWKKVSNATGYEVYRSTSQNSGYKKVTTMKKNAAVKFVNKSLKSGKTYYYKVRTYKTANGITAYGKYSDVKKVKVK